MKKIIGLVLVVSSFVTCVDRSVLPRKVSVQSIRKIKLGMTKDEVKEILGEPISLERRQHFNWPDAEVMIYFNRPWMRERPYPMLWVHLSDNHVIEVYAKRHNWVDSDGIYELSTTNHWENTMAFERVFPSD